MYTLKYKTDTRNVITPKTFSKDSTVYVKSWILVYNFNNDNTLQQVTEIIHTHKFYLNHRFSTYFIKVVSSNIWAQKILV